MMRLSLLAVAVALALESAAAFCILPSTNVAVAKPTFLKYAIVYPDDDDDEPKDKKPKEAAANQKSADGAVASFEGFKDYDELAEVTETLNVDAYDSMAGGILPGQQLSSLCSDD